MNAEKLPLWRLVAGLGIFGALIAILLALSPTYVENYELGSYVRSLASTPASATESEEILKGEILTRAHQLDLPVHGDDIHISHSSGKLQIQTRYKVKVDLSLYPVDLHMSAP